MPRKPSLPSVYGRQFATGGCSDGQLEDMIYLGSELDHLCGAQTSATFLRETFGAASRKDLSEADADRYIVAIREKLIAARAVAESDTAPRESYRITRADDRRGHKYDVFDSKGEKIAEKLPGITTPLGVLDKPALLPWISRLTGEAFKRKLREVLIEGAPIDVAEVRKELLPLLNVDGYKLANEEKTRAGGRGTDTHAVAEKLIGAWHAGEAIDDSMVARMIGDEPEASDVWLLCLAIREWLGRVRPQIHGIERMVACLHCGCAATLDLHCTIGSDEWVLDIKTSGGVYESHALQVAFQAHGVMQMARGLRADHCPVNRAVRIGALWVGKDADQGCQVVEFAHTSGLLRAAQQTIDLYRWKRRPWKRDAA